MGKKIFTILRETFLFINETVLLSTHNMCFGSEIRKKNSVTHFKVLHMQEIPKSHEPIISFKVYFIVSSWDFLKSDKIIQFYMYLLKINSIN